MVASCFPTCFPCPFSPVLALSLPCLFRCGSCKKNRQGIVKKTDKKNCVKKSDASCKKNRQFLAQKNPGLLTRGSLVTRDGVSSNRTTPRASCHDRPNSYRARSAGHRASWGPGLQAAFGTADFPSCTLQCISRNRFQRRLARWVWWGRSFVFFGSSEAGLPLTR